MRVLRNRGVAMVVALLAVVVLGGLATLIFSRSINEMRHSRDGAAVVQTLLLARGGANVGSALLAQEVPTFVRVAVREVGGTGPWVFGSGPDEFPEVDSVASALRGVVSRIQPLVDDLVCNEVMTPVDTTASVRLRIYFEPEACDTPLPAGVGDIPPGRYVSGPRRKDGIGVQEYALPFVMVAEGEVGQFRRNIVLQGEYRFDVGQASFAMYAYFTDRETSSGSSIWFTDETMIDGPVHTNGNFSFAYDPWFGGAVSTAGCRNEDCTAQESGAHFYRAGPCVRWSWGRCIEWADFFTPNVMSPSSSAPSIGGNTPNFSNGIDWSADKIPLPDSSYDQRDVARGVGRGDQGLHFADNLYSLEMWAGTSAPWSRFANIEDVTPTLVDDVWTPPSTYQYVRACATESDLNDSKCQVYRIDANNIVQEFVNVAGNDWQWETRPTQFNGVIYADGRVSRLRGPERVDDDDGLSAPPAFASFSQITLASESNIRITSDLRYEDPPCTTIPVRNENRSVTPSECKNLSATNVFGIYSSKGDILIGHGHDAKHNANAPDDVHVHAVLMSGQKQITVENYDSGDSGEFHLMGGMIQDNRGIFGTFGTDWWGDPVRTGYDRVYTYDPRMKRGVAPPFFPTTKVDDVSAVRFFSYGQREQLY